MAQSKPTGDRIAESSSADLGPSAGGALTSSADSISSDALTGACCISASREQPESAIRMAIDNAQADLITTRSEEHTSELQSLMRISYAVFCLKKKNNTTPSINNRRLPSEIQD